MRSINVVVQTLNKNDVYQMTIVPQILGHGKPLGLSFEDFELTKEKSLMDGMVQKLYLRKKI